MPQKTKIGHFLHGFSVTSVVLSLFAPVFLFRTAIFFFFLSAYAIVFIFVYVHEYIDIHPESGPRQQLSSMRPIIITGKKHISLSPSPRTVCTHSIHYTQFVCCLAICSGSLFMIMVQMA